MRHPLHPAIVHFPVACWSLAVAADFAGTWLDWGDWRWPGGLNAVGCGMALVAMLAGMAELPRVPEGPALRDVWIHMGAMVSAFTFFVIRLLLRLDHSALHPLLHPLAPDTLSLGLDVAGFFCLAVGGWFGGRLVYGHGIGQR